MSESLRSRMRALGTLGNRVGTILPGTKLICALVAIFALINFFAHDSKTLFSISTSFLSLPPKIWVFFSAVFYETSTLMYIVDFVFVIVAGRKFEPAWGTREFLRFVLIVILSSTISTTIIIHSLRFLGLIRWEYAFGMSPLYMAFAVATKQMMVDTEIYVGSRLHIRSDILPLVVLLAVFVFTLIFASQMLIFGLCGFVSSWVYLRYFQRNPGGIVGDPSNIFAMHTFFPEGFQKPIVVLEGFFSKLASLNPFRRFRSRRNGGDNVEEYEGDITVEISSVDAERRKQIALNAINEKLSKDNN